MKVSWFRALALIGLLADELSRAGADNRITVDEALVIVNDLANAAGIGIDSDGFGFTTEILTDITNMAADKKITIKEILDFTEKLCKNLGIEFDTTGVEIK